MHGINHPPPSTTKVKERVTIPLLLVSAFMAGYRIKFLLHFSYSLPIYAEEYT